MFTDLYSCNLAEHLSPYKTWNGWSVGYDMNIHRRHSTYTNEF